MLEADSDDDFEGFIDENNSDDDETVGVSCG